MPSLIVVNQHAIVPSDGGGSRHFDLGTALAHLGWDVQIVASDFHFQHRRYVRRRGWRERRVIVEGVSGIRVAWLWAAPYSANNWRRAINWLSFGIEVCCHRINKPDLVIGSSPQLLAAAAAWVMATRLSSSFVLEIRDLWPESLEAVTNRRGLFYWILRAVARFLYRRADAVIVLARGVADVLAAQGVPRERVWLIPNGVAPDAFASLKRPERTSLTLLYAGAVGPANGLDVVLDAADRLRSEVDIRFLLVGDGPAKDALVQVAEDRHLRNIEFRPPVPRSKLPELFATADAGLMVLKDAPLFRFGVSPNKLFDYLGAGLPVVCNVAGEVAELLAEAGAGEQAADASGAALADAILRLRARSPAERAAMGAAGRAWVLRERNRVTLAEQLDKHLRSLL